MGTSACIGSQKIGGNQVFPDQTNQNPIASIIPSIDYVGKSKLIILENVISAVAINKNFQYLVYAPRNEKSIKIVNIRKGISKIVDGHDFFVRKLLITVILEDEIIIGCGHDFTIRMWYLLSGDSFGILLGHNGSVNSLFVTNLGALISGSRDRTVCLWDLKPNNKTTKKVLNGHTSSVEVVAHVSKKIVSGGHNGKVLVWDYDSGKLLREFRGQIFSICSLVCCTLGDYDVCVSCSLDWTVKVHNINTGELVNVISGQSSYIEDLAIYQNSSSSALLVGGCYDGTSHIWDLEYSRNTHIGMIKGSSSSIRHILLAANDFSMTNASYISFPIVKSTSTLTSNYFNPPPTVIQKTVTTSKNTITTMSSTTTIITPLSTSLEKSLLNIMYFDSNGYLFSCNLSPVIKNYNWNRRKNFLLFLSSYESSYNNSKKDHRTVFFSDTISSIARDKVLFCSDLSRAITLFI